MEVERAFVTTPTPLTNTPRWRVELGENLRRLREERNLSVRELAGQAKMYWIELERYEDASQVPTLDRVYAIAGCLEVTIHDLLPPHA
ncbi:MAG: helix-turn-helix transcriptional regulator [Actinomycetota bacterium]|jgi:transcriptional regulator with XRE-family HTH domain|nr:helix-turn-helix transcriptional regulator [Actinomycetota bacterium]MEC9400028.1 helix-turn-helix transcriptional regulator [Myxococcota bacterium]MEC9443236.1 helix-turn-helix transcriptional regulator [Myxococcota bacterium]